MCELLVMFQDPDNFVRRFGGQERFNAVDITKWRIALTLKENDLELEKNKSLESLDNNDSGRTAFRQIALFAAA